MSVDHLHHEMKSSASVAMFDSMFESVNTPLHSMLILNISLHYIAFLFDSYFHLSHA